MCDDVLEALNTISFLGDEHHLLFLWPRLRQAQPSWHLKVLYLSRAEGTIKSRVRIHSYRTHKPRGGFDAVNCAGGGGIPQVQLEQQGEQGGLLPALMAAQRVQTRRRSR